MLICIDNRFSLNIADTDKLLMSHHKISIVHFHNTTIRLILRQHTKDFGILKMNHVSKHAFESFEAARPGECCNKVPAKQTEI